MLELRDVERAHAEIDSRLAQREREALLRGRHRALSRCVTLRQMNDAAWFMLAWARFEQHVMRLCSRRLAQASAHARGRDALAWRMIRRRGLERLHLMDCVALLLDAASPEFALADARRRERNSLAHGTAATTATPVHVLIADLRAVAARLRP